MRANDECEALYHIGESYIRRVDDGLVVVLGLGNIGTSQAFASRIESDGRKCEHVANAVFLKRIHPVEISTALNSIGHRDHVQSLCANLESATIFDGSNRWERAFARSDIDVRLETG